MRALAQRMRVGRRSCESRKPEAAPRL